MVSDWIRRNYGGVSVVGENDRLDGGLASTAAGSVVAWCCLPYSLV